MKLAIPFKIRCNLNDFADEFNIDYTPGDNSFEKLLDFSQTYKDKFVNIHFTDGIDVKEAKTLSKACSNVRFRLSKEDVVKTDRLAGEGIAFFFDKEITAYNKTSLDYYLSLGVCALYLSDDLWYSLPDVALVCHDKHVDIRLVANRIPSMNPERGMSPKDMILRPEDYELLDKYIDCIEFDCVQEDGKFNLAQLDVLKRVWFDRHNWHDDLCHINKDVKIPYPNDCMVPDMTAKKIKCGRKCSINKGCTHCDQYYDVALALKDKSWKLRGNPIPTIDISY